MVTKYHYSEKTQRWAPCRAFKKVCRYNHIESGEANKWNERLNEAFPHNETEKTNKINVLPPTLFFKQKPVQQKTQTNGRKPRVIMDAKGNNTTIRVIRKNESPLSCQKCDTSLSMKDYRALTSLDDYATSCVCANCGENVTQHSANVNVLDTELRNFNKKEISNNVWYHVTTSSNWLESIKKSGAEDPLNTPYVHLGSKEAAMDRLQHLEDQNKNQQKYHTHANETQQKYYMYAIKIKPTHPVSSNVFVDDNSFPETKHDVNKSTPYSKNGTTLYVNRYEAPGTVSLMTLPECLTLVESQPLDI